MPPSRSHSRERRPPAPAARVLGDAALLAAAAALLLLGFEWLFMVTKPSMFSVLAWPQKVAVLLAAALPVTLAVAACALLAAAIGRAWPVKGGRTRASRVLGLLVPALLLSATVLLLVENFTRTVLGFNLGSFESPLRYLYAAGFLVIFGLFHRRLARLAAGGPFSRRRRAAGAGLALLLAVSGLVAWVRHDPQRLRMRMTRESARPAPNLLILSSDGVPANQMTVYGYERPTTPFLASRAERWLVSENHVSNAGLTAGSTGALLTGKLPTTTGVTQQFHVFQGRDVYEHLPGILRQLGYFGIEIGERYYADTHFQNLRQGFHVSNSRRLVLESWAPLRWLAGSFPSESYFLGSTAERIGERLAHAFGVADMPEAILAPGTEQPSWTSDRLRIEALKREIEEAPRPFFAQVHLLDTHGPVFRFPRQRFSAGRQTEPWDRDFLDDAILGFDGYIEEIVALLEARGELESTILVINSDHGPQWSTEVRLPLLVRFPHGEHRGRIRENTQRIDIAPTVLSYLGVSPPQWMEGQSLLDAEIDPLRLIFATGWTHSPSRSALAVIQCQRWRLLDPDSGELKERFLAGHTDPCADDQLVGPEESRRFIVAQLSESEHFVAPLVLGATLTRLRTEDDPAERRRVARAIRDGLTVSRWLDDQMVVARAHWDHWTYSTSPAGLVVVNDGEEALVRQLEVASGGDREFPFTFHVDDGAATRDFTFERPGAVTLELAPVPPGEERLFVVWSDGDVASGRRRLGVHLAPTFHDRLGRLLRAGDAEERRRLTRAIVDGEIASRGLGDGIRIAGAHWDHWTRGDQRAALVVSNRGDAPRAARLVVHSGARRELPVRFYLDGGRSTREVVFEEPGSAEVELPPTPPRSERLFIVWSDRSWTPGNGDQRRLGVKLEIR